MDLDNSGFISFHELNTFIQLIAEPLGVPKQSPEEVKKMLNQLSYTHERKLTLEEIQPIIFMMLMQL